MKFGRFTGFGTRAALFCLESCRKQAPSGIGNMRLRHQYIISGLPRDVTLLGSDDENSAQPEAARRAQFPEHLSRDLLWNMVRSGRSLDERYVQHVKDCRD